VAVAAALAGRQQPHCLPSLGAVGAQQRNPADKNKLLKIEFEIEIVEI